MMVAHLVFSAATTGYILIAIRFEERDLVALYGPAYTRYCEKVPMLAPRVGLSHRIKATEGVRARSK